ncbi:MAG: aspartate aminotransferase family protein [Propionibacteriaceae bacterium]|jgi:4-aminobutyrate aminotransferase|nr:aspartate aminotransferase family protein [Propionibacteriaceae bacterium]
MIRYADYKQYLSPALAKTTEIVAVRGEGSYLWDNEGRRYIDWVQGIAVNALGHAHPRVVAAIQEQVGKLLTASFNMVNYESTLKWAKAIAEISPGELGTTFFSNGGAEAVDGALKLARAVTGRPGIISFIGSFHGRTFGGTSVTSSNAKYRKGYDPLVGAIETTAYPSPGQCPAGLGEQGRSDYALGRLQEIFAYVRAPETVAAILMEPVQGEGGYIVPPTQFVTAIREICDEHGILLIFDEIQSGYGRTGKFFASEHFGVVPDIMTVGKAMAGGLPASGIVSTPEIMEKWAAGRHGGTFGGNPVAAAAGLALLEEYAQTDLLANVVEQGGYLAKRTQEFTEKYPIVTDARGLGLMRAIELNHPDGRPGGDLLEKVRRGCLDGGLLTLACGVKANGLRFATPLNVSRDVLDEGLEILEGVLAKVCEEEA